MWVQYCSCVSISMSKTLILKRMAVNRANSSAIEFLKLAISISQITNQFWKLKRDAKNALVHLKFFCIAMFVSEKKYKYPSSLWFLIKSRKKTVTIYPDPHLWIQFFELRDHPFKTLANFHQFLTPSPYRRQFFSAIRRQIWQNRACRRFKWMVP